MKKIIIVLVLLFSACLPLLVGNNGNEKNVTSDYQSIHNQSLDGGVDYGRPPIPPIKIDFL